MELNLNDPEFIKSLVDYHWMYCFNARLSSGSRMHPIHLG